MKDIQKKLKDMVVMFISDIDNLEEHVIDDKVNEVAGLPFFMMLTEVEIEEVKTVIKSEFSIKLDKGVLIEEKGHEKWFLAKKSTFDMR